MPQTANKEADESLRLGRQIRDLRKAKGITLQELADKIEKSVGYVSQVERGVSTLAVPVLQQICDVLEVKISWFFQPRTTQAEKEYGLIVRASSRRSLDFAGTGIHEELLSPTLSGDLLMMLTHFAPAAKTDQHTRQRSAEEAGYILEGEIDLTIDDQRFHLYSGDSFCLQADQEYRIINPSTDHAATVLWVIASSNY